MTVSVSDIAEELRGTFSNVPLMVIEEAISDAIQQIYEKGWSVQETVTLDVAVDDNTTTYELQATEGNTVHAILSCKDSGGNDYHDYRFFEGSIVLDEEPATDFSLTFVVAVVPTALPITEVSDTQYHFWRNGIKNGAKALIYGAVGKPWSDPQTALFFLGELYSFTDKLKMASTMKVKNRPVVPSKPFM